MKPNKDWKNKTCDECDNWTEVQLPQQGIIVQKDRPKIRQCRVGPPHVVGVPVPTSQGLQVQMMSAYPKIDAGFPACKQFTQAEISDTIEGDQPLELKPFKIPGAGNQEDV